MSKPATEETHMTVTDAQIAPLAETIESLAKTGHAADLSRSANDWDRQDGIWVHGYKPTAVGRTAFVSDTGQVEWIA